MKNLAVLGLIFITFCSTIVVTDLDSAPPSHASFDALLKKYVNVEGLVNYKGLQKERTKLTEYLRLLAAQSPSDKWTRKEKLTYWINVYNAYTLELVLRYYPVKSIKDIGSSIQIPSVDTPWEVKFIEMGDKVYNLNNIENDIIRKKFEEPRIHFALVCAAKSCPKLRNEAYTASRLDAQLTAGAKAFLADPTKNRISTNQAEISKLFRWYKEDFTKKSTLIKFLNQYTSIQLNARAKISYTDYNWALNEQ